MYYEAKAKRRYLARESFLSVSEVPVCLSLRYPLKKSRARGPRGHKRERERERWQQRGSLIERKGQRWWWLCVCVFVCLRKRRCERRAMDIALEKCNAITMARIGAKALRERTQRLVSKVFGVVPATASRSSKSDYTKIWHRAFEDLKESHATRSSSRERKLFMELAEATIHLDAFKRDNAALRAERDSSIARCEAARKKMRRTSFLSTFLGRR